MQSYSAFTNKFGGIQEKICYEWLSCIYFQEYVCMWCADTDGLGPYSWITGVSLQCG